MDRSALLKLIHKDINELQLLLQGMEGYNAIPEPIIKLAKNKALQLNENIHELPGEVLVPLIDSNKTEQPIIATIEPDVPDQIQSDNQIEPEHETFHNDSVEPNAELDLNPLEDLAPESDKTIADEVVIDEFVAEEMLADESTGEASEIISEPELKQSPDTSKSRAVFGETIVAGEKVFDRIKNDISNSLSARLEGLPIKDLKRGININDRFMFQKELFANSADGLNSCIDKVNAMSSFDEALRFLLDNYEWNYDDDITKRFVSLVNRRYK